MRRLLSLAAVCILLMGICSIGVSAVDTSFVNNTHEEMNLRNAIANVQKIDGAKASSILSGASSPGSVYVNAGEIADMTAFFKMCKEKNVLPIVYVGTNAEANKVINACDQADCKDVTVISSDASVLTYVRQNRVYIRTGLAYDLAKPSLTSKEANLVRKAVRGAPATFCVISSEDASYQVVSELQELAVAVWVEVASAPKTDEFTVEALRALTSGANGVISGDAAALAKVVNTYFAKNTMTRTPVMIGHRGNPTQAPENTLSGFIAAYNNGADVFEIDVEITKDGEVIIMHDDSIKRTTNYDGNKRVGEMTLAEIKQYFILKGNTVTTEKVPTLKEVLKEFQDKDVRIFVEFKGNNIKNVAATAAAIKEFNMEDRVDVISFNTKMIAETHTHLPGVSTGYLHSSNARMPEGKAALFAIETSLKVAQDSQSSLNPNKSVISKDYLQAAADRGITVWPWTYNNTSNGEIFLQCPDGVTTDDVQWSKTMYKYLKAEAKKSVFCAGDSTDIAVAAVKYGGEETALSADDVIIQVISGSEYITVDGTKVTGVKNGTATILVGYKTMADKYGQYVLYAQPVTVKVGAVSPIPEIEDVNTFYTLMIVMIVVFIAIVAAVVTAVVVASFSTRPKD